MIVNFGLTFPKELLTKLDKLRGDIPRSVFLQRLVEKELAKREKIE
jgi:metal-responsive CopG/Arc/MetJ family transcriptional regulator